MPTGTSRYALSFTAGALLVQEATVAAPLFLREHDRAKVRQAIEGDNRSHLHPGGGGVTAFGSERHIQ